MTWIPDQVRDDSGFKMNKKKILNNFSLYAITNIQKEDPGIIKKIDAALKGGADIVQLRSKKLTDAALLRLALKITPLVQRHKKLFIINDRIDLALLSGADGVHLGQDDISYEQARKVLGKTKIIGRSTHSRAQAVKAAKEGNDYIGVGPVFSTPTKPTYTPVGLKLVNQVSKSVTIPFVAIGGIDQTNVEQVIEAGARGVAVVRAVFAKKDVKKASENLVKKINFIRRRK